MREPVILYPFSEDKISLNEIKSQNDSWKAIFK